MASGLPIITTRRGGNAEVMEDGYNGLLIKKHKEPAAFAAAINHLLDQPEKAAVMGRYGRLLAEKHLNNLMIPRHDYCIMGSHGGGWGGEWRAGTGGGPACHLERAEDDRVLDDRAAGRRLPPLGP